MQLLDLQEEAQLAGCRHTRRFPPGLGRRQYGEYQFGPRILHHLFCKTCGISSFNWGENPALGGKFYAISISCLDDATDEELASLPVGYFDGRDDRFDRAPEETRYL